MSSSPSSNAASPEPPLQRSQLGFSLLELIIVMSILALIAGAIAPRLSQQLEAARDARRLSDIQVVRGAIEQYFEDKGEYPVANTNGSFGGWDVSHDGNFISVLLAEGYLSELISDPINDNTFHFRYYVFNQGSYGCVGPGKFYVLGIRNFETASFAQKHSGTIACSNRDWGSEFDWVTAGGASRN